MSLRRALVMLLAAGVSLLGLPLFVGGFPAAIADEAADTDSALAEPATTGPVAIEVEESSGIIADADTEISLRVKITNTTDETIDEPNVRVFATSRYFISRSSLQWWQEYDGSLSDGYPITSSWAEELVAAEDAREDQLEDAPADAQPAPLALAPGDSTTLTLEFAATDLPQTSDWDEWGPRGISIELFDAGQYLEHERTFIVWYPGDDRLGDAESLDLSVLAPVVRTEQLQRVNGAPAELAKQVSWITDPKLNPAADLMLAAGDLDVTAFSLFDNGSLWNALTGSGSQAEILFNPETDISPALLTFAQRHGYRAITTRGLQTFDTLTYTPSAAFELPNSDSGIIGLNADAILNAQVSSDRGALSQHRLVAELAVIYRERPNTQRQLLVSLPRSTDYGDNFFATLETLDALPWLRLIPATSLLEDPVTEPLYQTGVSLDPSPGLLGAQEFATLSQLHERVSAQAALFPGKTPSTLAALNSQITNQFATSLRTNPAERSQNITDITAGLDNFAGQISVMPGSTINVISRETAIPIQVRNDHSEDVEVEVRLVPSTARLIPKHPDAIVLEAHSGRTITIPVRAVANGNVEVDVQLRTTDGQVVYSSDLFTVRVRAEWEDVGTAIVAGVVFIGFVIGLWRTLRRGKKQTRQYVRPED